ncbi:Dabb family protein [Lachnospiraceae bacterium 54-53]
MIRHILFWKLTEEVKRSGREEEAAAIVAASVQTMAGRIDGMLTAELGKNEAGGEYDLIFYSEFRDQEALEAFRNHPLHAAHRERCRNYVTGRLAGDLVTEN